jgi:hypothetical protein
MGISHFVIIVAMDTGYYGLDAAFGRLCRGGRYIIGLIGETDRSF